MGSRNIPTIVGGRSYDGHINAQVQILADLLHESPTPRLDPTLLRVTELREKERKKEQVIAVLCVYASCVSSRLLQDYCQQYSAFMHTGEVANSITGKSAKTQGYPIH